MKKNYCMQALKRECRNSIIAALLTLAVSITIQIVFILNFRNLFEPSGNKTSTSFWIIVVWIIMLITPIFAIINCYKKLKDKENTTLVQYIRKQLSGLEHSRDIEYIFKIVDTDLANAQLNIRNFHLGNEWMIGSTPGGSVAIKYINIQSFQWKRTRISDADSYTYKYTLFVNCLGTAFEFEGKGKYETFLYLQNLIPEKEYTRDKARDDLENVYHAIKNAANYKTRGNDCNSI